MRAAIGGVRRAAKSGTRREPKPIGGARIDGDDAQRHDLLELIAALHRRVPQMRRAGEISIARDAAALKAHALKRIEKLEGLKAAHGAATRARLALKVRDDPSNLFRMNQNIMPARQENIGADGL